MSFCWKMNLSVKHYDQGGECWVDHVGSDVSVKIKICWLIIVVGIQVLIEFGESSRNPYMVLSPCGAVCIYIGLRPLKKIGEPKKRGATSAQSAQSQLSHRNHRKGSPPPLNSSPRSHLYHLQDKRGGISINLRCVCSIISNLSCCSSLS